MQQATKIIIKCKDWSTMHEVLFVLISSGIQRATKYIIKCKDWSTMHDVLFVLISSGIQQATKESVKCIMILSWYEFSCAVSSILKQANEEIIK